MKYQNCFFKNVGIISEFLKLERCIGFTQIGFCSARLQRWLLWEAGRIFSDARQSQCSKADPPLAKAETICNGGSTPGLNKVKNRKKPKKPATLHKSKMKTEKGVRRCKRNSPADIKVSEGGRWGSPGAGAEGTHTEAPCSWRTVEGNHAGAAHEEQQPVGQTHVGEAHRELSTMGGVPCWSRRGVWGVLSLSSHAAGVEEVEKINKEIEPRKTGGVRGKFLKAWFYFQLSFSALIGFPKSLLPMRVTGETSLPALLLMHEPFVKVSLPFPTEEGSDRVTLVSTWCPDRVDPLWKDTFPFQFRLHNYVQSLNGNTYENCSSKSSQKSK